ncbi:MAG: phosphate ABC transporter permease PstA [Myxococcota bacterium]
MSNDSRPPSRFAEVLLRVLCLGAAVLPVLLLLALIVDVAQQASGRLSWEFVTSYPSRHAEKAGILPGIAGSLWLITITAGAALPLGVGAALYLEEYAKRGRLANLIEVNLANLAGVPSIIYGLLGLELFVRFMGMGRSLLAGGLAMALLVLPVVIMSSREALRTVPTQLREAGMALGSTRWQVTRQIVLPMAMPGILTGAILAIARAIGEAAPLILLGALTYVDFLPDGVNSPFTVLPIQIFNWVSRPQPGFVIAAAAGIIVLLVTLLFLSGIAIYLRNRFEQQRG